MERVERVEVIRTGERPDYLPIARALLPKIRKAAEDPDFIRGYEKWKKEREGGGRNGATG